jgi:AcrR family transcriptional regulator
MVRRLPEVERRTQILDAAKRCFVEHGFAATRMDDVAAGAQLSKGGLYFHYKSKQDLMVAVVERENRILDDFLHQVERWGPGFAQQLERMIEFYFVYLTQNVASAKLSQCALDEAERNERIAQVLAEGEERFINFLTEQITRGKEDGQIKPMIEPLMAARICMAVIEGIKTKYLQFPDWPWPELLETTTKSLFHGLFERVDPS